MFRYRVEYMHKETLEYSASYFNAENVDDLVKVFRQFFSYQYRIIEVSKCIDRVDWSKK